MQFLSSLLVIKTILLINFIINAKAIELEVTHQVYFEVNVDDKYLGRIEIGLFGNIVPKTVDNFYTIATKGINGKTYNGSVFHRVVKKFLIQGGDIIHGNGHGVKSIYGKSFEDENFKISHAAPGFISMANSGPNTNGCQFFITTVVTPWLDGNHVVFGKVTKGQATVHKIEKIKTDNFDYPLQKIQIVASGSIDTPKPFYVSGDVYNYSLWDWISAGAIPLSFSFAILLFFQWVFFKLDIKDKDV